MFVLETALPTIEPNQRLKVLVLDHLAPHLRQPCHAQRFQGWRPLFAKLLLKFGFVGTSMRNGKRRRDNEREIMKSDRDSDKR